MVGLLNTCACNCDHVENEGGPREADAECLLKRLAQGPASTLERSQLTQALAKHGGRAFVALQEHVGPRDVRVILKADDILRGRIVEAGDDFIVVALSEPKGVRCTVELSELMRVDVPDE